MSQYVQLGSPASYPLASETAGYIKQIRAGWIGLKSVASRLTAMQTNGAAHTADFDQIATLLGIAAPADSGFTSGTDGDSTPYTAVQAAAKFFNAETQSTVGNCPALDQLLGEVA